MPPKRKAAEISEEKKETEQGAGEDEEEATTPLSGLTFFFASKLERAKATVTKEIRSAGGSVASSLSKKVTHVIATQEVIFFQTNFEISSIHILIFFFLVIK